MEDVVHLPFRPYIVVRAEPQKISILLGRYNAYRDVTQTLRRRIRDCVDINLPFKIEAIFQDDHWPLEDGFRALGRLLAFLGNELLDFGLWQELEIKLPDKQLPFYRLNSSELPLEAFTELRDLTWSGHPQQILDSWLPLTPSLLQNLEVLTITCNISSHDFAYILRQVNRLKTLSLKCVRRDSFSASVTPPAKNHTRKHHSVTALEHLTVISDEDICLVFDQFYFPSLLSLTLKLTYTTSRSNFHDLESFNWGALERFELRSDLRDVGETKLHTLLSTQAEFSPHNVGLRVGWTTTPPAHV